MAYRQKYLYRRDELSNSPYANRSLHPENSAPEWINSGLTRDVDGTFTGEWGYVQHYDNSGWSIGPMYWTSEVWSENTYLFYVYADGDVSYASPSINTIVIMCRGD